MADSTTTIVMVLVLVIILCSSCSSSVTVLANENPSFGGSFLDFLRGDWYNNIFGYPVAPPGEYENEGEGVDAGGNEDDGDKDNDKDRSKPKDNCVYLYKNKNGKKYLISKCTSSTKTYNGSNVEEVSSIKVGKDLTVYVYDKDNKKKMYKGNKNKTYNLPSKWNDNTRKLVLKHKDGGSSSGGSSEGSSGGSSKGENSGGSDSCSSKICLYEHRDYGGKYLGFDGEDRIYDFRNNSHMKGKISSMKIDGEYQLRAYTKPKYSGTPKVFTGNTHWIGNTWNDKINSFIIQKKSGEDSGGGSGGGQCNPLPFGPDTSTQRTEYKTRDQLSDGSWACVKPYVDTGCDWGDGGNERKHCAVKQKRGECIRRKTIGHGVSAKQICTEYDWVNA